MFAQIKGIVDLVVTGFKAGLDFKTKRDRDQAVFGMLRFYFVLKDCIDEGNALILDAGADPVQRIMSIDAVEAKEVVARWDAALRRQAARLYSLAGQLGTQHALAVLNPALIAEIQTALGSKMTRTLTLSGIGSALVIRTIFPLDEPPEQIARLISVMAGERSGKINLKRIGREIDLLERALDGYREHVGAMVSKEELLRLSVKARSETQFPVTPDAEQKI